MNVIYRMKNKVNGKSYIGQTNNFPQRMRGHKSDAFNKNSKSHKTPLSNAIRKYGWDNFYNEIIEEIPVNETQEYIDNRERYYIEFYESLSSLNGYNITTGGQGNCNRPKKTYEESIRSSKIFSPEEIIDIQNMLLNNEQTNVIREKYYPRLSVSFLDNINNGLNFRNDKWKYPLRTSSEKSLYFTSQEMKEIKEDIKSGKTYKEISDKWDITIGFISGINNGKSWKDENETYPLCVKGSSRLHNLVWVVPVQEELMNGNLPMTEIARKYNKAYSTIKKINSGSSHKNPNYRYPLTSNRK